MKALKHNLVVLADGQAAIVRQVHGEGESLSIEMAVRGGEKKQVMAEDVIVVAEVTQHWSPLIQAGIDNRPVVANTLLIPGEGGDFRLIHFMSDKKMSHTQALAAIRRAVDRWMLQTYEGVDAWKRSEGGFNLSHLVENLGDARLGILLRAFGVHGLVVEEVIRPDADCGWSSSDILLEAIDDVERMSQPTPKEDPPPAVEPAPYVEEKLSEIQWDSGRDSSAKK